MNKKYIIIILLLGISLVIYRSWVSFNPFSSGDWGIYFKDSLLSNNFPSIWSKRFEGINVILWNYPLDFLNGLFGYFGSSSIVSEKFLYFWQIIFITPISSFFLIRKITKSNLAGFVGSLVFSYNSYFLSINTQGHLPLVIAFSWGVFAILSFIYLLETKKRIYIPLSALLLFIVGSYDLRSLYVSVGIIFLYAFYNQFIIEKKWRINLKINFIYTFVTFFILGLLNLFWILPFIFSNSLTSNIALSREIISGGFYDLQNVIALFFPFWTGYEPTWFFSQQIPTYFWLYPVLAFLGLIFGRRNKQLVFWGIIAVLGIFLTKQDTPPFANLYVFLYDHLPGFNAFREASKFYYLIVLSYSVLIGGFALFVWNYLKNRKYLKFVFIFLLALLPLWNAVPILTGNIGTLFIPKEDPKDLSEVNLYLTNQNEYSRVFWINLEKNWILSTNKNPVLDGSSIELEKWKNQANIEIENLDLSSEKESESQKMINFINSDVGRRMLDLGSFGYIVVTKDKNDWINSNINRWDYLEDFLKKTEYLCQEKVDLENTLLFKNNNKRPHIYITNEKESVYTDVDFKKISFEEINPSEYKLNIKKINSPFYLNFSDNYHPDWTLYVGKFNWLNVLQNKNVALNNKDHFKNEVGFNSFYVDPKIICEAQNCKLNKDGSYDIALTLFFKPQAYLYFGLIISASTLILSLISMIYLYRKKI